MSEKFLDQSGLVVLRNWVRSQIANVGGSGGSAADPVLLWENAAYTGGGYASGFEPQSISLPNLDLYNGAVIEYAPYADGVTPLQTLYTPVIPVGGGDSMPAVSVGENYYGGRYCSVLHDQVIFLWGHNHAVAANNKLSVPVAIYGIPGAAPAYLRPDIIQDREYIVVPRDYIGTDSGIRNLVVHSPTNGKAYKFAGWMTTRCGTGLTVVTPWESSSWGYAKTTGLIDLTGKSYLHIRGWARCYNGNDCIGLAAASGSLVYISTAADIMNNLAVKQDLVSASDTMTRLSFSLNVSSLTGDYALVIMCAGSGSNTGYPGIVCIEEAWLQ